MHQINSIILLFARLLFGCAFIGLGSFKIANWEASLELIKSLSLASFLEPALLLSLIFLMEILGGLFVALGYKTSVGALFLLLSMVILDFSNLSIQNLDATQFLDVYPLFLYKVMNFGGLMYIFVFGAGRISFDR